MAENEQSKRQFLKKSIYVVPTILTLQAIPAFAGSGSGRAEVRSSGFRNRQAPHPHGNPPANNAPGAGAGNPGKYQSKKSSRGVRRG